MTTTTDSEKNASVAERGIGFSLRHINRLAGSDLLDRIRIRKQVERALFQTTKNGFRTATAAGRTFQAAQQLGKPARQKKGSSKGLFDLGPDDEQQMFQEGGRAFAADKVRPAAHDADANCETPAELLAEATELGVNMLGVPEELGGVMHEQSAVTSVLIGEALAHGDMGIAYAALAPGAVATAIGLWGSAEQEATYLPAFTGEDVPAAALAILEPRPLFDPLKLETTAKRKGDEWVLKGTKSLLARAKECELFVIAAEAEGIGPALFIVESGAKGLSVEAEPAMGLRPAATGSLLIENVKVPASALLGEGEGEAKAKDYVDCVNRSRIAWSGLATGAAQAVLDYVIPYVNDRQAFGEPISNRQGVAFIVSDIGIESDGIRLATYRAASRADRGEKFAREAAIARRLSAVKGMEIGSAGVQLLGGHGFVKEHPVERWYRDLRAAGVMEGALLV